MLMHMKPLYTVKKIQKFFRAPLKNYYLHFLTIKYNYYSTLDNKY